MNVSSAAPLSSVSDESPLTTREPPAHRRAGSVLPCIFLGVFLLRFIVLVRLTSSQFLLPHAGDMQFYNSWALRILHGEWTTHTAFYGLPLYAYLLAAVYKIAGYSPFVPGLLQALLDGGTAVLLYKISGVVFRSSTAPEARAGVVAGGVEPGIPAAQAKRGRGQRPRLQRAQVIGLSAAVGWAFFQPAEAYSVILMPTSWLIFVFWFVVWEIVKTRCAPTLLRWLLLGGLIGFTAMGIATILFLVPLLIAALLFRWRAPPANSRASAPLAAVEPRQAERPPYKLTALALLLIGVCVGASPAWIHNYFVARDPVFLSAHSGVNFWIGNNPVATGYPNFPPGLHASQKAMLQDSISIAEKNAGRPLKRSEVSSFWSAKARGWIEQHPAEWLRLLAVKIKNFWNAFQYDDLSIVTALRDQGIIFPGIGFGLIAALALPGMLIACRKFSGARWIAAAVLLQMASLLTVFVTERYRLAAVPGLLLFAAFGIWELWRRLAQQHLWATAFFLLLLVGTTGLVSLPQKNPTLFALDTYNSGVRALDSGDFPLAREKLDRAYSYSPFNAGINFAEGNLHLALGEIGLAKNFYLATLRLDPQHVGACNNLGVLALREQDWSLAVHFFHHALAFSPNDAKLHYLLARAAFGSGNLSAASAAISDAIKLDPSCPEFRTLLQQVAQPPR